MGGQVWTLSDGISLARASWVPVLFSLFHVQRIYSALTDWIRIVLMFNPKWMTLLGFFWDAQLPIPSWRIGQGGEQLGMFVDQALSSGLTVACGIASLESFAEGTVYGATLASSFKRTSQIDGFDLIVFIWIRICLGRLASIQDLALQVFKAARRAWSKDEGGLWL